MKTIFQRYRPELDAELRSIMGPSTLPLYDMMRYHLGWVDDGGCPQEGVGGKELRSTLCFLACEAVGGDYRVALPAAAAIEFIHNYSLIHDDIEDRDSVRRHRPTVWWLWGQPQAINAGDAMYTLAHLALFQLEEKGVAAQKILRAARLLDDTCLRLCEGQHLDLSYESRLDIGVDAYLEMISSKTAALFECSLKLGALLGTEDELIIGCLGGYGRKLGLAFQIRDDVLGIWGKGKSTGKPEASDIRKRKKSLPVVYGLGEASGEQRGELLRIYQKGAIEEEDVARVLDILNELGAQGYAQRMAEQYYREALAELELADLSLPKSEFRMIATFLVEREY